ncbi:MULTISPECIES: hypothetical protein [unclassified Sphingomonas]|uniref:hypothetical protein n=1 Tax=unclassified Sphingomonas TaxID=196159 RepID=UPI0006F2A27A|nr:MULTISPECIES: hypothetical protein [unclassified Sphingomonas]KQM91861.1 hypothetical protein ASE77_11770 [Sphingomonas sp. Leaf226]MDY0966958.1 hypothetical protein [Sphingomonas sp. CFBP9021]
MMSLTEQAAARLGSRAAEIGALCAFLSEALCNDPTTARAGEAVEGLGSLADSLARDLLIMADPNA